MMEGNASISADVLAGYEADAARKVDGVRVLVVVEEIAAP
jgi:hypothetical protein